MSGSVDSVCIYLFILYCMLKLQHIVNKVKCCESISITNHIPTYFIIQCLSRNSFSMVLPSLFNSFHFSACVRLYNVYITYLHTYIIRIISAFLGNVFYPNLRFFSASPRIHSRRVCYYDYISIECLTISLPYTRLGWGEGVSVEIHFLGYKGGG